MRYTMTFPGWAFECPKNWHGKPQVILHNTNGGAVGAGIGQRWYYSPVKQGGK
jgi:hypothetical protein